MNSSVRKGRFYINQSVEGSNTLSSSQGTSNVSNHTHNSSSIEVPTLQNGSLSPSVGIKSLVSFSTAADSSTSNSGSSIIRGGRLSNPVISRDSVAVSGNHSSMNQLSPTSANEKKIGRFIMREVIRSNSESSLSDSRTVTNSVASKDLCKDASSTVDAQQACCSDKSLLSTVYELNSTVLNRLVNIEKLLGVQQVPLSLDHSILKSSESEIQRTSSLNTHEAIDRTIDDLRKSINGHFSDWDEMEHELIQTREKCKEVELKYEAEKKKLEISELNCERVSADKRALQQENHNLKREIEKLRKELASSKAKESTPPKKSETAAVADVSEKKQPFSNRTRHSSTPNSQNSDYARPPLCHSNSCSNVSTIQSEVSRQSVMTMTNGFNGVSSSIPLKPTSNAIPFQTLQPQLDIGVMNNNFGLSASYHTSQTAPLSGINVLKTSNILPFECHNPLRNEVVPSPNDNLSMSMVQQASLGPSRTSSLLSNVVASQVATSPPTFSTINVSSMAPMIPVGVDSIPTGDLRPSTTSTNDVHQAILSAFSQPPSNNQTGYLH